MDPSWQPVTGAAQRRRGRRLRAAWRHEQQSIARALATFTHHSSRGQRTARAGEWGSELNYTATIRKTPTPQAAGTQYFAMDVDEVLVAGSRPDRLTEAGRRSGFCGALWSRTSNLCVGCRFSMLLCRRWWTRLRKSWGSLSHCLLLPSRLSKCPRSFLRTPFRSVRCCGLRSWRNSWWKCRRLPVVLLQSWPCKPWGGGKHGPCLSSSTPPGQGGIQILAAATVAEAVVDVSVTTQLRSSRFSSSSSTEWWCSCFTETGTQCKLCRSPSRFFRCSSWTVGTPVVVQRQVLGFDSAENWGSTASAVLWQGGRCSRCCSSSTRFGRPCDFAVTSLKGFLRFFRIFRAPLGCPGVERQSQPGSLDDEEFFVIEGWGVALTPGVSPRCQATSCA